MAICKRCGEVIQWRLTESGKWQPMNPDGSVHFPTCRGNVEAGRQAMRQWYQELSHSDGETPSEASEQ